MKYLISALIFLHFSTALAQTTSFKITTGVGIAGAGLRYRGQQVQKIAADVLIDLSRAPAPLTQMQLAELDKELQKGQRLVVEYFPSEDVLIGKLYRDELTQAYGPAERQAVYKKFKNYRPTPQEMNQTFTSKIYGNPRMIEQEFELLEQEGSKVVKVSRVGERWMRGSKMSDLGGVAIGAATIVDLTIIFSSLISLEKFRE